MNGVKDAKIFLKKDNSQIKTILKELKEGGLYDYKQNIQKKLCRFI